MEVTADPKKREWTREERKEKVLARIGDIKEQRREELIDFATQAVALGRDMFLDVYNAEPSLRWWVFDFARLEHSELHDEFYRVCIKPTALAKNELLDKTATELLEKNRIALYKKMEMYGDNYQIVSRYTTLDSNDVPYKTITVGIPFRDKDERRERIYCSMCINDIEHPKTYLMCLQTFKERQPMK